jgi:3-deoxy-7-phosphoheptulonate synthase
MIIQLHKTINPEDLQSIFNTLESNQYSVTQVKTQFENYLVCIGKQDLDIRIIGHLKGVKDIHRVSDNYKLVSRKWKTENTKIDLGNNVIIGNGHPSLMAGPCSIESEEQVSKIVAHLLKNNIKIMRGGVYKPRSSPYAFRGLGIALGEVDKPVMIKRGISGTIEELLNSAEYIFSKGNEKLLLCERGIRTFETLYRNTFDINAIQILKDKSHLPVIADPSHGIGIREYVTKLALASLMAGADGIIYEVHEKPEEALSDGQQTLNFIESEKLVQKIEHLKSLL